MAGRPRRSRLDAGRAQLPQAGYKGGNVATALHVILGIFEAHKTDLGDGFIDLGGSAATTAASPRLLLASRLTCTANCCASGTGAARRHYPRSARSTTAVTFLGGSHVVGDCLAAVPPQDSAGTSDISSGIFTLLGAVLGSGLTYLAQATMAGRSQRFARDERHRAEQIDACSRFASAAMEARRAQKNRWYQRRLEGPDSSPYSEAKAESYRLRAAAWQELYRAELVTNDPELSELARQALNLVADMHNAPDEDAVSQTGESVRKKVEAFVQAARRHRPA